MIDPSAALRQLSEDDWKRLRLYAQSFYWLSRFYGGPEPEDLINTVIERFLAGERRWNPHQVDLCEFLMGVISSIVSAEVEKAKRRFNTIDQELIPVNPAGSELPEDAALLDDFRASLHDAPHLLRVLEALVMDEQPRHIAAKIDVSLATVYRHIRQLLHRFLHFIEQD